ncbi:hypothetical protein BRADI_1g50135v3 [Brachypodium distachyon]|uniref:Uncharacterized protein n=1 Tax=Brachypodium distachyon TaxID=15368 RepID=A0A2K2DQP8_BRADI|nr:hypothetical protein BRADI_1g50135v3 [Brachypodium distachyon]
MFLSGYRHGLQDIHDLCEEGTVIQRSFSVYSFRASCLHGPPKVSLSPVKLAEPSIGRCHHCLLFPTCLTILRHCKLWLVPSPAEIKMCVRSHWCGHQKTINRRH